MPNLQIINCLSFTEFFEATFHYDGGEYEVIYSRSFNPKKGSIYRLTYQIITLERYGESYSQNHPVHKALESHLQEQKWQKAA